MSDDKRPRPWLDLKTGRAGTPPRLDAPQPGTAKPRGGSAPYPAAPGKDKSTGPAAIATERGRRGGASVFSHLLASVAGGAAVAGVVYLVTTGIIPGISLSTPDMRHELRQLEERTAALDHAFRAQEHPAAVNTLSTAGPDPQAVNEIRARLDGVVQAEHSLDGTVQTLSGRLDALEKNPQATNVPGDASAIRAETARQIAPLSDRLTAVERQLGGLAKARDERQAEARSAGLTLAADSLKRAILEGRPFGPELAAVNNMSAAKLPVAELEPYQDSGIPTLDDLRRKFDAASRQAIEKFYSGSSASFVGEMIAKAKAAIQVKPKDGSGSSVEAVIGRMDVALKAGDVKAALAESAGLQGPAREAMQAWLNEAQLEVTASEALKRTDRELLASVRQPSLHHP